MKKSSENKKNIIIDGIKFPLIESNPKKLIEDFLIFIYGRVKIGKSEFCSHISNSLFLETEPGLKFLKVKKMKIASWKDFCDIVKILEKKLIKTLNYKCIVVDTVDNLSRFCMDFVCTKKKIEHPSDQEWGKGWEALFNEWHRWIVRLSSLSVGVIFIGHHTEKEMIYRNMKITRVVPALGNTFYRSINALVDFIFYVGNERVKKNNKWVERRFLYTRATENIEAGSRGGNLPAKIKFDFDIFKKNFII